MKTKPQTQLTPEQVAARKAAEAFFGDLLKPAPKLTKAATTAKVWRETATRNIVDKKGWRPTLRLYTVTHQHCTTCNSDHTYAGAALIQYTNSGRKDSLTVAIPATTPADLTIPHSVTHTYEDTTWCATCLALTQVIDGVLVTPEPDPQLSLFN